MAGGVDARQPATGEQPETSTTQDSYGIDVPGVGHVGAPEVSPVELRSGREDTAGKDPYPADPAGRETEEMHELRERLVTKLLISARDLAMAQLEPASVFAQYCTECAAEEIGNTIAHRGDCRTARVLRVIADLIATIPNPEQKEAARDEESPCAGDGIRPQGSDIDMKSALVSRVLATELLSALYTMIGRYGMPDGDAAAEVHTALLHAAEAEIGEVRL